MKRISSSLFAIVFFLAISAAAQTSASPTATPSPKPSPTVKPKASLEKHFIQHVFHDQADIWTSPFRLDKGSARWMAPAALGMAGLFATDRTTSDWVGRRGGLPVISRDVSWFGKAYTTGGVAGAFYVIGGLTHNEKARETGVLALESLVDTGIVTEVLKVTAGRNRPNSFGERAEFFDKGSSFPSGHSSTVWSVATVIAYEYRDNPWIKYGAFAAATAVSMSRFSGRNHFLSDIVIGSAIGFGIGRYVFKEYHDADLDQPKSKTTTWLKPQFVPFYSARTHTYGGSLIWRL